MTLAVSNQIIEFKYKKSEILLHLLLFEILSFLVLHIGAFFA